MRSQEVLAGEQVCIEQTADAMDQVQAAAARELAISNLDRSARWLREIGEALRRLDTGEFGTGLNCEAEIGAKRLRAVAWTQLCLRCQELAGRSECSGGEHYAGEPLMNAA